MVEPRVLEPIKEMTRQRTKLATASRVLALGSDLVARRGGQMPQSPW